MFYFLLFRPIEIIYVFGGVIMTVICAAGYVAAFVNIAYIADSSCSEDTTYGSMSIFLTIAFLILGSIIVLIAHLLAFLTACKECCCRNKAERIEASGD